MRGKAVFLDRDGVLIKDKNLLTSLKDVELFPSVGEAVAIFRKLGFKIILFTNQTVVARGMLSLEATLKLNDEILNLITIQHPEAKFDDVFLCPHHPKATVAEYRRDCECRKPKAGMLLDAGKKFNLDLSSSVVIGDRPTDIYAGNSVNCETIQIHSGEHEAPLIETTLDLKSEWLKPSHSFSSLVEAARFLQARAA